MRGTCTENGRGKNIKTSYHIRSYRKKEIGRSKTTGLGGIRGVFAEMGSTEEDWKKREKWRQKIGG